MPLTQYAAVNGCKSTLKATLTAAATTAIVETGEGARFGSSFPLAAKLVKRDSSDSSIETQREMITITARSGDTLTISRGAEDITPSTTSNTPGSTAYEFDAGDEIIVTASAGIQDAIIAELVRLEDEKASIANSIPFGATSVGTDAYKITDTGTTTYVNGKTYKVQLDVANTGASTFEVNTLGAVAIKKIDEGAYAATETGDMIANQIIYLTYNSAETCFELHVNVELAVVIPDPSYSPTNYTEASSSLDGHLEGIDDALGTLISEYDWEIDFRPLDSDDINTISTAPDTASYKMERTQFTDGNSFFYIIFLAMYDMFTSWESWNILEWGVLDKMEIEMDLWVWINTSGAFTFYIGSWTALSSNNLNGHGVGFTIEDNGADIDIYIQSHDGTTQSEGTHLTLISSDTQDSGRFKLVYDVWTDIKLYKDGTLLQTKTTNLPTSGTMWLQLYGYEGGSNWCGNMYMHDAKVRLKKT